MFSSNVVHNIMSGLGNCCVIVGFTHIGSWSINQLCELNNIFLLLGSSNTEDGPHLHSDI